MPLTAKGKSIMAKLQEEYGEAKGKSVFYAMRNAGKISGVDEDDIEDNLEEQEAAGDKDCHCHDEKPKRKPIHIVIKTK